MLNAGVIGAGHLGKIHLKLLNQSDKYNLVGFYDSNPEAAKNISEEFGYKSYKTMESLIKDCDMVDVVTPTLYHSDCAKKVLNAGKHLFIEKPITKTVQEAEEIRELAKKNGVRGQGEN